MQQLEVNRLRRKWQERCASSGRTDVKAMQLFTEMHNKRREWTRAIEKAKASHWKDFLDRDIRENLACGKMIRLTYALLEKGYKISEYNIEEISLVNAENFKPEYLAINPMGTVPSLVSPSLSQPLVDSRNILEYLDRSKQAENSSNLVPPSVEERATVDQLIDQVHSDDVSTNILLFMARDKEELEANKRYGRHVFLHNRQKALEQYRSQFPDNPFYGPKLKENGSVDRIYETQDSDELDEFFRSSELAYRSFISGLAKLDSMLNLPYAAGNNITAADLHIAPWLSHAMMAVGTENITDLDPLESHLQKTSPQFTIGKNTREWWFRMNQRTSFKEFFPKPR